jgi:hypothetical protein
MFTVHTKRLFMDRRQGVAFHELGRWITTPWRPCRDGCRSPVRLRHAAGKAVVKFHESVARLHLGGVKLPAWPNIAGAMIVGFLAYGVSLTLFVLALRHLGTARAGAYFSVAPFVGALLALVLGEPITLQPGIAVLFMAFGLWLHLTEQHSHTHHHLPIEHDHDHNHDEHHQHVHDVPIPMRGKHRHRHRHAPLRHAHPHYPDAHHHHEH